MLAGFLEARAVMSERHGLSEYSDMLCKNELPSFRCDTNTRQGSDRAICRRSVRSTIILAMIGCAQQRVTLMRLLTCS